MIIDFFNTYIRWYRIHLLVVILFCGLLFHQEVNAITKIETHFPNTQYQLDIFRIYGHDPGNTMLIIGGIQDEPGGYLTADLYVNLSLAKGNLIVVPRANFNTIIHGVRGINGDMNRKFNETGEPHDYDEKIVAILKKLISESDVIINLHSGSGFYRETKIDDLHNPMRYGQSIIADAEEYYSKKLGRTIQLREMGQRIAEAVNKNIDNSYYYFRFNNHRTSSPDSPHREQRKSATYFALTHEEIPAFGLEVSQELPNMEMKVRHMIWVINEFLKEFGIVPDIPNYYLDPPGLEFLVVSINNGNGIVVTNESEIHIKPSDQIEVQYISANYKRGLSVDVLGYGTVQDLKTKLKISKDSKVIIRKDNYPCGHIWIKVDTFTPKLAAANKNVPVTVTQQVSGEEEEYLVLEINGKKQLIIPPDTIKTIRGDKIRIVDISQSLKALGSVDVNFYGYQAPNKSGEDRGYEIDTGKELLPQFSLDKKGFLYAIRLEKDNKVLRQFVINVIEPELYYLVFKQNHQEKRWIQNQEILRTGKNDTIEIVDVKTNIPVDFQNEIRINLRGSQGQIEGTDSHLAINLSKELIKKLSNSEQEDKFEILITRHGYSFGKIFLHLDDALNSNLSLFQKKVRH